MKIRWDRYGGYECSSAGDKRFSAFFARLPDGRSIEEHYQCDIKGYDPGGTDWKLGKRKPPRGSASPEELYARYLELWRTWALQHRALLLELRQLARAHDGVLSDRFATSDMNQAHALADLLNSPEFMDTPLPAALSTAPAQPPFPVKTPAGGVAPATKIPAEEAYASLFDQLELMGEHEKAYAAFHQKHKVLFLEMPASIKTHHCWPGGYAVHIAEVVANMVALVRADIYPETKRVSLVDAVIAAYVHDLDKLLVRYVRDPEGPTGPQLGKAKGEGIRVAPGETKASLSAKIDAAVNGRPPPLEHELPRHAYNPAFPEMDDSAAVAFLCAQHGLTGLNWDILHAVSLHHGGWAPLARFNNQARPEPLAILLHAADQLSAGIQNGDL